MMSDSFINSLLQPCQRRYTIFIPKDYVWTDGKEPHVPYNAQTQELQGKFDSESRDCIH